MEPHEWTPEGVSFHLDGTPLRHVAQSPACPMQLMLNICRLPDRGPPRKGPSTFTADWVRGYAPT